MWDGHERLPVSRREFMMRGTAIAGGAAAMFAQAGGGGRAEAQEAPQDPRIKQSFTWGTFGRGVEPETLIRTAAEIGYKSIEMGPRQHWPAIRAAGMKVAIFGGHGSLGDGFNDPKNADRIERELSNAIDVAVENGVPSILCLSGNRKGRGDEEMFDASVALFKRVIAKAEDKGIDLAAELLNSKVNHPDYWLDHTSIGVELCKRVDSPCMKLLYDIYHMQIMEGDLIRTITQNVEYIAHFHTAGNPGRNDPDETQEIHYPAVMRAIADKGYQGYVGHEFGPKGDRLEAMRKTFDIFNV